MLLLNEEQTTQKIKRLAIEIMEQNFHEAGIVLVGINKSGTLLANQLLKGMEPIAEHKIELTSVYLNPANPMEKEVYTDLPANFFEQKVVVVVDDVANTGRTLHYSMKPFLSVLPKKIEVAVLVDRQHKLFPIATDYVGITLATTLQENIDVRFGEHGEISVFLN